MPFLPGTRISATYDALYHLPHHQWVAYGVSFICPPKPEEILATSQLVRAERMWSSALGVCAELALIVQLEETSFMPVLRPALVSMRGDVYEVPPDGWKSYDETVQHLNEQTRNFALSVRHLMT